MYLESVQLIFDLRGTSFERKLSEHLDIWFVHAIISTPFLEDRMGHYFVKRLRRDNDIII